MTTTPFCTTRLCLVSDVQRCIPEEEICDKEKFCNDGTDENASLFPNVPRCQVTGINHGFDGQLHTNNSPVIFHHEYTKREISCIPRKQCETRHCLSENMTVASFYV